MTTSLPIFHPSLSGSKAPLLAECSYFASPSAVWGPDKGGPAAIFGLAVHRVGERSIEAKMAGRRASDVSVADIADEFDLDEGAAARLFAISGPLFAYVEHNARLGWRVEVPFAWDPVEGTARELPKGAFRDYSGRRGNEIPMTLDLVAIDTHVPTRGIVLDFKSGWHRVAHPRENRQLLSQACAYAETYGFDEILLVVLKLESDRVVPVEALVNAFELEAHREWMEDRLRGAAAAEATPGDHCAGLYCPAKVECPATMAAVGSALAVLDVPAARDMATHGFKFGLVQSPEHAAWMLGALDVLKLGIGVAEKSLRAYADEHGGIPLPDGRVWQKVVGFSEKPDLSNEKAKELLERHGALGAVSTEESLTWKDLETLLGKGEAKKVRAALVAAGAVTKTPRAEYKEVTP